MGLPTVRKNAVNTERWRIKVMLRYNVRDTVIPVLGENVLLWRDKTGWIGTAVGQGVDANGATILHNGLTKKSALNRIRTLRPDYYSNNNAETQRSGTYDIQPCDTEDDEEDIQIPRGPPGLQIDNDDNQLSQILNQ